MNLKVLLFGISKELIGATSIVFSISPNTTILEFKTQLKKQYPQVTEINSYAIAVNESYASNETVLKENDIIAIIPPVSGG
jgi:molybdopterin converting factor subunit 1